MVQISVEAIGSFYSQSRNKIDVITCYSNDDDDDDESALHLQLDSSTCVFGISGRLALRFTLVHSRSLTLRCADLINVFFASLITSHFTTHTFYCQPDRLAPKRWQYRASTLHKALYLFLAKPNTSKTLFFLKCGVQSNAFLGHQHGAARHSGTFLVSFSCDVHNFHSSSPSPREGLLSINITRRCDE